MWAGRSPSMAAPESVGCHASDRWRQRVFAHLARLHFAPCTPHTPIVVHWWAHAGLGNALGQLLLSLHFATLHGRQLVIRRGNASSAGWVWLNASGFQPHDLLWPSSCERHAASLPEGTRHLGQIQQIQLRDIFCPTYGCPWANALPPEFEHSGLCVMTWYGYLLDFILRPSERMLAWLHEHAVPHCPPGLCASDASARWQQHRITQIHRLEAPLLLNATAAAMPPGLWRAPLALALGARLRLLGNQQQPHGSPIAHPVRIGLHVRAGDACGHSRRPAWQRPACAYTEADGWGEGWEARIRSWVADAASATGGSDVSLLLSTDSERAHRERAEMGARLGSSSVHSFGFPRRKYASSGHFVEDRLRLDRTQSNSLDPSNMLAEALTDLTLLAHANSLIIGSLYSNFARLALSLSHVTHAADTPRAATLDAGWCPYHVCQAGCTDVARLCHEPMSLALSELSGGTRGSFEAGGGVRPRRLPSLTPAELQSHAPAARRPWVALMAALLANASGADAGDKKDAHAHLARARAACQQAFAHASAELGRMPLIY